MPVIPRLECSHSVTLIFHAAFRDFVKLNGFSTENGFPNESWRPEKSEFSRKLAPGLQFILTLTPGAGILARRTGASSTSVEAVVPFAL